MMKHRHWDILVLKMRIENGKANGSKLSVSMDLPLAKEEEYPAALTAVMGRAAPSWMDRQNKNLMHWITIIEFILTSFIDQ